MADKLVVMNAGIAEQVGKPMEIYRDPDTVFRRRVYRLTGDELSQCAD